MRVDDARPAAHILGEGTRRRGQTRSNRGQHGKHFATRKALFIDATFAYSVSKFWYSLLQWISFPDRSAAPE